MANDPQLTLSEVLHRATEGDNHAAETLLPLVYDELKRVARAKLAQERPGQTLQATALVHEAYLRVVAGGDPGWDSRAHFMASAAEAMRRILVEQARRKAAAKRPPQDKRQALDDVDLAIEPPSDRVLDVEDVVRELEESDPRKAKIVVLRYYAGLTAEETAAALDVSIGTVERDWRFARALLQRRLDP